MRVAFLIHRLEGGGAERQMAILAAELRRLGHEVLVISFYAGGQHQPFLEQAGVQVRSLGKTGRYDILRPLGRLVGLLEAFEPQVLHGYMHTSNLLASMLSPLLPRTRIVWGIRASSLDLRAYGFGFRVLEVLERLFRNQADLIISNSGAGRRDLLDRGFSPLRVAVVPNGIQWRTFQRDDAGRADLRRAWGLGAGDPLVGLVGRLDPMKDHPTFLQACSLLKARLPGLKVLLLGNGPEAYRQSLVRRVEDLGLVHSVIWESARTDLPQVYSALDLLCLPSSMGEGFSNVLAEARACGTPCLATAVGDAHLLLPSDRLVPVGDPAALARKAEQALRAGPAAMAEGPALIRDHYSPEALALRTSSLLTDLI